MGPADGQRQRRRHAVRGVWRLAERNPTLFATPSTPPIPSTPARLKTDADSAAKLGQYSAAAGADGPPEACADAPYGLSIRCPRRTQDPGARRGRNSRRAQRPVTVPAGGGRLRALSRLQLHPGGDLRRKGPVADAVLSYSQSTDPASPHHADRPNCIRRRPHRRPSTADVAAETIGPALAGIDDLVGRWPTARRVRAPRTWALAALRFSSRSCGHPARGGLDRVQAVIWATASRRR